MKKAKFESDEDFCPDHDEPASDEAEVTDEEEEEEEESISVHSSELEALEGSEEIEEADVEVTYDEEAAFNEFRYVVEKPKPTGVELHDEIERYLFFWG